MYHYIVAHQTLPTGIFIASFIAFIILNLFENIIHFNAGKHIDEDENKYIYLNIPTKKELIKIIVIMVLFAFLQGIFTLLFFDIGEYFNGKRHK